MTGRIPIRARGLGALPVPGWTDEYAWVGTIAYDDLPRALNPTDGAIVTANNRVTDAGYPYHLGSDWNRGLRAARIAQMLSAQNAVSIADCCAVQDDALVTYAHGILRNLEAVIPKDRRAAEAVEILRRWDRRCPAPTPWCLPCGYAPGAGFGDELGATCSIGTCSTHRCRCSMPWTTPSTVKERLGATILWAWSCARSSRGRSTAPWTSGSRLGPSVRAWRWGGSTGVHHPTMGRAGIEPWKLVMQAWRRVRMIRSERLL